MSLLAEIIKSPLVKGRLNERLRIITPDGARSIAKTALWQDIETSLGVLGALPQAVNALVAGIGEAAGQFREKFTPALTASYLKSIASDIDTAAIKETAKTLTALAVDLWKESPELKSAVMTDLPQTIASAVNACSRSVNELAHDEPEMLENLISGIMTNIDKDALGRAASKLADALLDTRPPVVAWGIRFAGHRMKRRLDALMDKLGVKHG